MDELHLNQTFFFLLKASGSICSHDLYSSSRALSKPLKNHFQSGVLVWQGVSKMAHWDGEINYCNFYLYFYIYLYLLLFLK